MERGFHFDHVLPDPPPLFMPEHPRSRHLDEMARLEDKEKDLDKCIHKDVLRAKDSAMNDNTKKKKKAYVEDVKDDASDSFLLPDDASSFLQTHAGNFTDDLHEWNEPLPGASRWGVSSDEDDIVTPPSSNKDMEQANANINPQATTGKTKDVPSAVATKPDEEDQNNKSGEGWNVPEWKSRTATWSNEKAKKAGNESETIGKMLAKIDIDAEKARPSANATLHDLSDVPEVPKSSTADFNKKSSDKLKKKVKAVKSKARDPEMALAEMRRLASEVAELSRLERAEVNMGRNSMTEGLTRRRNDIDHYRARINANRNLLTSGPSRLPFVDHELDETKVIVLCVDEFETGDRYVFKMNRDSPLAHITKGFCLRTGKKMEKLWFMVGGGPLNAYDSPNSISLKCGDFISARAWQPHWPRRSFLPLGAPTDDGAVAQLIGERIQGKPNPPSSSDPVLQKYLDLCPDAPGRVFTASRNSQEGKSLLMAKPQTQPKKEQCWWNENPIIGEPFKGNPSTGKRWEGNAWRADPQPPTIPQDLKVKYVVKIEAGEDTIQIPIDSMNVTGHEKDIVVKGMPKVWKWVRETGLGDRVSLNQAYELAKAMFQANVKQDGLYNWVARDAKDEPDEPEVSEVDWGWAKKASGSEEERNGGWGWDI